MKLSAERKPPLLKLCDGLRVVSARCRYFQDTTLQLEIVSGADASVEVELETSGPLRLLDKKFTLEAHAKHEFSLEIPAIDVL